MAASNRAPLSLVDANRKNLTNAAIDIEAQEISMLQGPPNCGKTAVLESFAASLTAQKAILNQINGYGSDENTVSGQYAFGSVRGIGKYHYFQNSLAWFEVDTTLASLLFKDPTGSLTIDSSQCPNCAKNRLVATSPDALSQGLIGAYPKKRCAIFADVSSAINLEASTTSAAFLEQLHTLGLHGFNRVMINDQILDLDEVDSFDVAHHATIAINIERLVLQETRLPRLKIALEKAFSVTNCACLVLDQGDLIAIEGDWFCLDCYAHSNAGLKSPLEQPVLNSLDLLDLKKKELFNTLNLAEQLSGVSSEQKVGTLSKALRFKLFLLHLLTSSMRNTLLLFDHDALPLYSLSKREYSVLQNFLTSNGNSILSGVPGKGKGKTFSVYSPWRIGDTKRQSTELTMLRLGKKYEQNEFHYLCISHNFSELYYTIQDTSILLSESSTAGTAVQVQALQTQRTQLQKSLGELKGLYKEIALLYAKLSLAKQHGVTSRDFLKCLKEEISSTLIDSILFKGFSINDIQRQEVRSLVEVFALIPKINKLLSPLLEVGLGSVPLQRTLEDLSSSELAAFLLLRTLLSSKKGSVLLIQDHTESLRVILEKSFLAALAKICIERKLTVFVLTESL